MEICNHVSNYVIAYCIKPQWQSIKQDEGKLVTVTWNFNGNETIVDCNVKHNNTRIVAGMKKTRVLTYTNEVTMLYGTALSMLIKPFNSTLHLGNYVLSINTTNGIDIFHYDATFELAVKTLKDVEEGK